MNHPKRDTASGVLLTKSNDVRAMRVRMPKIPANLTPKITGSAFTTYQPIITAPPTDASQE